MVRRGEAGGGAAEVGAESEVDPRFVLDADELGRLAWPEVVQRGLQYAKDNRVKELGLDDGEVWAVVEDERGPDYRVEILARDDGGLEAVCECREDEEQPPASRRRRARRGMCHHAVAALAAFADREAAPPQDFADDAERAIAERRQRGRTTVRVEHVAGDLDFGEWRAQSANPSGASRVPYKVVIRSTSERINFCSCPDFATNLLGTCKHIEAVLHKIHKKRRKAGRKGKKAARTAPKMPVVYVDWDAPGEPRVRLRRTPHAEPALAAALDAEFDAQGFLRGRGPGELFHVLQRLRANRALAGLLDGGEGLHVGEEAIAFAQRELDAAARDARSKALREELERSGGHVPGIRAKLSPYQVEGVAFLAGQGRALLADDMGLGKTLQAIVAAHVLMEHGGVQRTLVVCPASLKHEWAAEVRRFTDIPCQVIEGRAEARRAQYRNATPISIANYELVRNDRAVINQALRPDLIILDEAQRIKNWKTKTATDVKAIQTRFAFVLTGTPLENRLEDLYSVMQVVDPHVLGPLWLFMKKYHVLDERGHAISNWNLSELRQRLRPVMLRRTRAVVLDQLPPITHKSHEVALSPTQRAQHSSALKAASQLARIRQRRPLTPTEQHRLLAALQTARMACNAAGLVEPERMAEGSPKLDELKTLLQELAVEGGEKVVIFSQWERMTRMVQAVVEELGLGFERLHGAIPTAKRRALFERFRKDPACRVFITTDAGKEGLNLQNASVVINMELPYNPATLDQRIGRVHRRGQSRPVLAIQILAANSYESHVASLVQTKRGVFQGVFDDESGVDVVGLTDKALSTALEALDKTLAQKPQPADEEEPSGAEAGVADEAAPTPEEPAEGEPEVAPQAPPEDAAAPEAEGEVPGAVAPLHDEERGYDLGPLLGEIKRALGGHLDRVLAVSGGLVCVTVGASEEALGRVEALESPVDVAVVERDTWANLQRVLGGARGGIFAGGEAEVVLGPSEDEEEVPPLVAAAQDKLAKAERLREEDGAATARLATEAMASALAHLAQRPSAPELSSLAVWLYGELVPKGLATVETAGAVLRAQGLAQAPQVPPALIHQVLADAHALVNSLAP